MGWTVQNQRSHFAYGSAGNTYYWTNSNIYIQANALSNCMANCTTLAYGRVIENGNRVPIGGTYDGGNWHNGLINSWTSQGWSSYYSSVKAGDLIEWSGHILVVEYVDYASSDGRGIYCSSSLYTGDNGSAYAEPGNPASGFSPRTNAVMGSTLQSRSNWMINNYPTRFYQYDSLYNINQSWFRINLNNATVLINPDSGGGGPTPPPIPPTETLTIDISPSSYNVTMQGSEDYVDFTFNISISGIPAGETVSGGNTYPDLTRVYNSGWSYSDYTVSGVTYRSAFKTQTLRYERESSGSYTTVKHMYFNISKSTGTVSTDTPMYITIKAKSIIRVLASMRNRKRKRGRIYVH